MNKYFIINGNEYLCSSKGEFTDSLGNKRKRLDYWNDVDDRDRIKTNILKALFILFTIKLFASDIKAKLKKVEE